MINIYFVRHGQTDMNQEYLWSGSSNAKLTAKGIEQANKTAKDLKDVKIDIAFVSPLQRAIDTFNIINKYHNLTPIIDNRIKERSFGNLEGTSAIDSSVIEKDKDKPGFNDILKTIGRTKVERNEMYDFNKNSDFGYNIEKIKDVDKRVKEFLDEIIKKYQNKNILVVAHGAIGRHFEVYFNGLPKDGIIVHGPKNAEVRIYSK